MGTIAEMGETCALDVADRGEATLEDVGACMNVTRERIRRLEAKAIPLLQKRLVRLGIRSAD